MDSVTVRFIVRN